MIIMNYHSGFTILINTKHQKLTSNKELSVKTFIKTIFFLFLLQDLLPGSSPLVKGRPRPRVNELKVTLQILFWALEAEDSWFLQGRKRGVGIRAKMAYQLCLFLVSLSLSLSLPHFLFLSFPSLFLYFLPSLPPLSFPSLFLALGLPKESKGIIDYILDYIYKAI